MLTVKDVILFLVTILSFMFTMYIGLSNKKRNDNTDVKSEATQLTTVLIKLEHIGNDTSEIKSEISNVKKDVREDRERIFKVEESARLAHERMNRYEVQRKKRTGWFR